VSCDCLVKECWCEVCEFYQRKRWQRTKTMILSRHRMEVQVWIYDEEDYLQCAKVYEGLSD
jgi:hypothetical protein